MNKYPPRPKATREVILKIAADAARELADSVCAEDIADAYMGYGPDGFSIAKKLDRDGWDLSADCVGALHEMHYDVSRAVADLEKAWAENIQLPLEIGAEIKEGVITGILRRLAYYMVKKHGCTDDGRRLLVKFEDAREAVK